MKRFIEVSDEANGEILVNTAHIKSVYRCLYGAAIIMDDGSEIDTDEHYEIIKTKIAEANL